MEGQNSQKEEFDESNLDSEIQHVSIRDRAASKEEIRLMARHISSSSSETFSIEFCDCNLTADHLTCLCDGIKNRHFQIVTFAISYMDKIDELLEKTCFIIWKYGTTSLSLEYDELTDRSLELFQLYLEDEKFSTTKFKIEKLDISFNNAIGAKGFEYLGRIMKKFNIVSLKATDCDITDEKLEKFFDALGNLKLKELDISGNENLTNEGFRTLVKFVSRERIDRLELSSCKLSKENLNVFQEFLPSTGQEKLLEELDVSYNSTINPSSLGSAVVKCGVTKLILAGCKLSKNHLVCLRRSMNNHKMDLLDMNDNASIGKGVEEIAKLVKQCNVTELNICDCMFSPQELENFKLSLDGAQIGYLHIGDERREPDKIYVDELCSLLEKVKDVLYLRFHKLGDVFRTSLQERCTNFTKIVFIIDGKKEEFYGNKSGKFGIGKTSDPKVQLLDPEDNNFQDVVKKQPSSSRTEKITMNCSDQKSERSSEEVTQSLATNDSDSNHSEDSSDAYSLTSIKTQEFNLQNLEQPVIGSTEKMLKKYSATLENMSPLMEDLKHDASGDSLREHIQTTSQTGEFKCQDIEQLVTGATENMQMVEPIETMLDEYSPTVESRSSSTKDSDSEYSEDSSESHSPTSIKTKEFNLQNAEQPVIESTEKLLNEYSATLENVSSSAEDADSNHSEDSAEAHSPTSLKIKEFYLQNVERPVIGSTEEMLKEYSLETMSSSIEDPENDHSDSSEAHAPTSLKTQAVIGSTEKMLKEYSATLEHMSSSTEDIEVVFENEIFRIFCYTSDFLNFAQSEKGLHLDKSDIQCLFDEDSFRVSECDAMAVLKSWKEKNEPIATPSKIREIVKRYVGEEDILNLYDGRIRAFQNHKLYKKNNMFLGEILTNTGYRFCAIRLFDSNDTQVLDAAKTLLSTEHDNIVSVLNAGTYRDKQDWNYAATELRFTKDLDDIFKELSKIPLDEETAMNFATQMFLALDFIHSHGLKGDLTPFNISISKDRKQLKLDYFDISQSATVESQIFTAGILLAQILTNGEHPFGEFEDYNIDDIENFENLILSNLVINNKKEAEEVIMHILDRNPENRPTAVQVLSDITFLQYPFKATEDEPAHVLIQRQKSTKEKEEITQWTLDKTGKLKQIGVHQTNIIEDVERVVICDREVSERDIRTTTSDGKSRSYIFEFWGCHITKDFLNSFCEKMDSECQIESLKIVHMKPGRISGLIETICSIVKKWKIEKLSLEHDHLNDDDIDLLRKGFDRWGWIDELDISYNKDITSAGFRKLGEIGVDKLLARACDVTDEKLQKLFEIGYRMNGLDLSCNPNLTTRGYAELAKYLALTGSLKLSACELTKEIIDEFYNHLSSGYHHIEIELDVSYNPGITPDTALGSIIVKGKINKLNLSGCEFDAEHFAYMKNSTPEYKLNTLCLRDNNTISSCFSELVDLAKHWNLEELDIGDCMLTASDLRDFREKLDEVKFQLPHLHLGDEMRVFDASYMEEVGKLLSNVKYFLHLQCHKLNIDLFQFLYKHVGQCHTVVIKFSDGIIEEWKKYDRYATTKILNKNPGLYTIQ